MMGLKRILAAAMFVISLVLVPSSLHADLDTWQELLGPVVKTHLSGGSGTVIHKSERGVFILTNRHVVRAFTMQLYKAEPAVGDNIFFTYYRYLIGRVVGKHVINGNVVLLNKRLDLALVKVITPHENKIHHVARLATLEFYKKLVPLDDVVAVGCPAGLTPVPTCGTIMKKGFEKYTSRGVRYDLVINAPLHDGNSGGALYRKSLFIGVPSAISNFRLRVQTEDSAGDSHGHVIEHPVGHIGFVVGISQIYPWLIQGGYQFILPGASS